MKCSVNAPFWWKFVLSFISYELEVTRVSWLTDLSIYFFFFSLWYFSRFSPDRLLDGTSSYVALTDD